MDRKEYTEANRIAWNESASVHKRLVFDKLLKNFQRPSYSCLDDIERRIISKIGLEGKNVAQLCCNNGRELLSIKNLGAERCVGFDISDDFIEQARQLANAGGIACEFVQTDVYDIPTDYDANFDLVYISVGALGWMPDLEKFFRVIKRLLKPFGWLFVYETHPMLDMFESDCKDDPPKLEHSYFREKPYIEDTGLDYYGHTTYKSSPTYWFHHKMSDIIDACLKNRLELKSFQEYDHDITNEFAHFEKLAVKPPLSYTLTAQLTSPPP
ncbi:MAG: class I SAM-dependent methyltransferase [Candidatus Odinarchaeota archaeon]